MNKKALVIIDNIIIFSSLTSSISAVFYYFWNLDYINIFFSLLLAISVQLTITQIFKKIKTNQHNDTPKLQVSNHKPKNKFILPIVYFLLLSNIIINFFILISARTGQSLISPWENISVYFFGNIILGGFLLFILFYLRASLAWLFLIFFTFLFNTIAIIIYRFGFGFDFFVHQATLDIINTAGQINPKPLYYLSEYSLIIILHKLFLIPLYYLHLLLVPILASLLLPINLLTLLQKKTNSLFNALVITFFLILLPLSLFFNTTPQNFAWLFLLLVIIRSLSCQNYHDLFYMFSLSILASLAQPLAGLPAIALSVGITIYHSDYSLNVKKHLNKILFILSSVALPVAFILIKNTSTISASSSIPQKITTPNLLQQFNIFKLSLPNQENIWLNFIYFFAFNIKIFLFIILASGIYIFYKNKQKYQRYQIHLYLSLAFFLSFLIVNNMSFDYLINYEQKDFANRILTASLLLLLPFFIFTLNYFLKNIQQKNKNLQIIWTGFFIILIPVFFYLNYPRWDNYHNTHGYSLSQDDITTVHWINNNASTTDYIVLANQQTSAAALREFGFKKYYTINSNKIFYYPIPTSSPLYTYYLSMVNKTPNKKTMHKAMDLMNVKTAYFVINKYWWAFDKIIKEAKLEADSYQAINNGHVYIFKFTK